MRLVITLLVLIYTCPSVAVVTRHDVPAASYQLQQTPGFYIDMPHEGAGVLIDERWILTAAHVIYYDYRNKAIEIHGVENRIEKVVFHQQYRPDPGGWGQGDAKPLIDFLRNRSDVVLLKLAKPVTHVQPIQRYTSDQEIGNMVTIYGKGATGTGLSGAQLGS